MKPLAVAVSALIDEENKVIQSYFGEGMSYGVNLTYSQEDFSLGTGGAIKSAEKYIDESRFAKAYVNDKYKFNKWGRIKIRFELSKSALPFSRFIMYPSIS